MRRVPTPPRTRAATRDGHSLHGPELTRARGRSCGAGDPAPKRVCTRRRQAGLSGWPHLCIEEGQPEAELLLWQVVVRPRPWLVVAAQDARGRQVHARRNQQRAQRRLGEAAGVAHVAEGGERQVGARRVAAWRGAIGQGWAGRGEQGGVSKCSIVTRDVYRIVIPRPQVPMRSQPQHELRRPHRLKGRASRDPPAAQGPRCPKTLGA